MSSIAKLNWYRQRLRSMSAPEVAHRFREAGLRRRYRSHAPAVPESQLTWTGAAATLADTVLSWVSDPDYSLYVAERTAQFLDGDIELMGYHWKAPGGQPEWHYEPYRDRTMDLSYCFDVDYRHGGAAGEVRLVWELNRCLWLLPVLGSAVIGNDGDLAASCDAVIESWIAANPLYKGVNWSGGIEVAHHIVALLVAEELLGRVIPDAARRTLRMRRVAVMVDWIRRFPSLYSSANNHRVCELAGILIGGIAIGGVADDTELDAVTNELRVRATGQHGPDGFNSEQAPHYGIFTLEWLLCCTRIAEGSKHALGSPVTDLCTASARTIAALTDEGGNTLRFGDDDDASVLSFCVPPRSRISAVLELAGVDSSAAAEIARPGLAQLGDCWYSVARSKDRLGETFFVFDHAPLGFGSLSAHGHADALSVWLSVGGKPLFVEAGTYLYHAEPQLRDYFRSTRAHNTLTVEGLSSSVPSGSFNWRRDDRATCAIVRVREGGGFLIEAEHTGYERRLGTRHVRSLERLGDGRYRIEDCLTGTAQHRVEASFVLAPDVEAERFGSSWVLRRPDGACFSIAVSPGFELSETKGSRSPFDGWCSPAFGHLEPTFILRAAGTLGGGCRLVFDLDVSGNTEEMPPPS